MESESSILIIDDDPASLNLFADIFLKAGFHKSMGAVTGKEVKNIISEKKPDIILLDVNIKGEDSLKILNEIKLIAPELPTIMLAGEEDLKTAEEAIKLGASSYVIKSSPVSEIVDDVKKALDKYLSSKPKKKVNILAVDDDREVLDMVKNFLKAGGYSCTTTDDAQKALRIVKTIRPDLIFLDVVMPKVDGLELLSQIKAIDKKAKVVMMSGVTDKDICMDALAKGAAGYIAKPFSLQQIKVTTFTTLLEK